VVNDGAIIDQGRKNLNELTAPILGRSSDMASVANAPNILASGVFGTTQIMGSINALEQQNQARTLSGQRYLTL
jgi:hypothetical protein